MAEEMLDDETLDTLNRIIESRNKRGHAADRHVPSHDLELRAYSERDTAEDFARAYAHQYGQEITDIRSNENDPPDCIALKGSEKIGIEITELVKSEILKNNAIAWKECERLTGKNFHELTATEKRNQEQNNHATNFEIAQWTRKEFLEHLRYSIAKKDRSLANCSKMTPIILVIYTAEDWLENHSLRDWLTDVVFSAQNIMEIFLLGPYEAQQNAQTDPPGLTDIEPPYPLYKLQIE